MRDGRAVIPPATGVCFGTPRWLYEHFHQRFRFALDPCPLNDASIWDGRAMSWEGHRVFCNPPYGRKQIPLWIEKRWEAALVLYLLPARTDTEWWYTALVEATEIVFIRNRICFVGMRTPAYFPSVAIVYEREPRVPEITRLWLSELEPSRGYRLPQECTEGVA